MNQEIIKTISEELNVRVHQIEAVLSLLEEGNTVPFIARYRKEKTGALDEDQIRTIDKYYQYQVNLLKRKEDVIRLIDEKGMLNEKLKTDILKATQLSEVEDLYRPYKEKRKTKATAAKAKGLEPLAKWILALNKGDILVEAKKYFKGLIIAGKMHAAGIDEPIVDMNSIKEFIEAGADVILMPAVNTVPGLSEQEVTEACRYIKAHGALSLSAIGTSQEGADEGTIREIALLNKRCGIDIQHIGDAGFCGIALPENIMALSIAIRGKRHTYHKIASSINR